MPPRRDRSRRSRLRGPGLRRGLGLAGNLASITLPVPVMPDQIGLIVSIIGCLIALCGRGKRSFLNKTPLWLKASRHPLPRNGD
jgi:hypothetical protein